MAGRRGAHSEEFERLADSGAFIVVHPKCDRPILVLDIWATRTTNGQAAIRVEGICKTCDRYVRLEYLSQLATLKS